MHKFIAASALVAMLAAAAPSPLLAEPPAGDFGKGDVCKQQKQEAGTKGALIGAIGGALLGRAVAAKGHKTDGTLLGAAAGAGVGYGVGRASVTCIDYPPRIAQTDYSRQNCRWVQQSPQDGKPRQFEVCQNADGIWRASGRE
ncbi:MAG: glycine zipper 2TM domain-containing protein [Phenylobacterium sp.]